MNLTATTNTPPPQPVSSAAPARPAGRRSDSRRSRFGTGLGLGCGFGMLGGAASGSLVVTLVTAYTAVAEGDFDSVLGTISVALFLCLFAAPVGGVVGLVLGGALGGVLGATGSEESAPTITAIAANLPHIVLLGIMIGTAEELSGIAAIDVGTIFVSVAAHTWLGRFVGQHFAKRTLATR